jgi:hypothetical protein
MSATGFHHRPWPERAADERDRRLHGDQHGNRYAEEGCDRCPCGCKYWERDVCASCGEPWHEDTRGPHDLDGR